MSPKSIKLFSLYTDKRYEQATAKRATLQERLRDQAKRLRARGQADLAQANEIDDMADELSVQ